MAGETPDVQAAREEGFAVLLDVDGVGAYAYGPFDEEDLAARYAAYLTAEVDPARVVPLAEVGPARPRIVWQSAVAELLNWREYTLDQRHDQLGEIANALEALETAGRIDRITAAELSFAAGIITRTRLDEIQATEAGEGR